jgi:hypothetical protein
MKNLLFILFSLFFCNLSHSQNENFIVNNKIINWNFVYQDSNNIKLLRNEQLLDFVTDSTGYIKKTNFSDKKLQTISAEFKIQTKENRYKVTVFNIRVHYDPVMVKSLNVPETAPLEETFLKSDGTIRKQLVFGYNFTELFNPYFTNLFTIKKKEDDNW